MRGKSVFTIKFSFLFAVLILGLNFSAYSQNYPFKDSEKLAKVMLKAKVWGIGASEAMVNFIQTIPDKKQVEVWTFTGIYSSKVHEGWNYDKVIAVSGQEVRDAFVIHQAYRLWSKGELKESPAVEEVLAQELGFNSKTIGDSNNQKVANEVWQKVVPYYNKASGYKVLIEKGYSHFINAEKRQNLNRVK